MALINCPECGHEISTNATACPNCGFNFAKTSTVPNKRIIISEPLAEEGLPKWVIPAGIVALAILGIVIFAMMRNSDDANRNINVQLNQANKGNTNVRAVETPLPNQVSVAPSSTTVNTPTTVTSGSTPATSAPVTTVPKTEQDVPSSSTTVAPSPSDKGLVKIDAKVSTKNGGIQAVKNEKFYLLDEDLESILSKAKLEPIEGNSLSNSFGLSVLYPEKYGQFNSKALFAIKNHIKYNVLTDANGKAAIKDVKPDSYYLFGITKSKTGFAIWDSPVSINTGENQLNLSPPTFNEIAEN